MLYSPRRKRVGGDGMRLGRFVTSLALVLAVAGSTLAQVRRELAAHYPNASAQLFSSLDRTGLDAVHAQLDAWFGYGAPAGGD